MHTLLSLTTLLAFWSDATTAADAAAGVDPSKAVQRIPMVRLRIDGLSSDDDGKAVMKALSLVPNIKVATRPTMKDPTILVGPLRGATYDLGDLAKAVAGVKPSGTKHSASTSLVFDFRPRDGKIVSEAAL
jgi:hypothetical protein